MSYINVLMIIKIKFKVNIIILAAKIQGENEESSEEDKSESKVAFLARKIRNLMRKKRIIPRRIIIDRGEIEKEKERKFNML